MPQSDGGLAGALGGGGSAGTLGGDGTAGAQVGGC